VKNYTKYGPTGLLWALYLIVGIVAFLVSNLYFKFALKDAIIFGVVNLVVVVIITEGIDFIFKKTKLRQERKDTEETPDGEPVVDKEAVVIEDAESEKDSVKADEPDAPENTTDKSPSDESMNSSEEPAVDALPVVTGQPGGGKGRSWFKRRGAKPSVDSTDSDNKETTTESPIAEDSLNQDAKETTTDDEAPLLITGAPGSGKNWHLLEQAVSLKKEESVDSDNKETSANADAVETIDESLVSEESLNERTEKTVTNPVIEESSKPRGRRANPEAIIDAPTSSMPIITPDMIKPKVEPAVEPVVEETVPTTPVVEEPAVEEPAVEEPIAEEPYLSADEFLDTTKLTSPRAIVREYQRLGGKDDIFSILMARQK
jgi:hypothetical protein